MTPKEKNMKTKIVNYREININEIIVYQNL